MTTTVDIPEEVLKRAMRSLEATSPQEAIIIALERASMFSYLPPAGTSQKDLIPLLGTCDDDSFLSPEELEKMRSDD